MEFTIVLLFRTGGGFMSVARHAVKVFYVALLILSLTVAVSAQNIAELKKQAAAGDAKVQYSLGVAYANGYGVSEDKSEALRWWRKAADQGYIKAEFRLGVAYDLGDGVPKDEAEAARWYRKAADQGYAEAQFSLGAAYRDGAGVPKDNAEAYFWLSLAATGKVEGVKQEDLAKARDEQAFHLTKAELSQVQERVQKWVKDHVAKTNSQ
jgi:TPR repeat protein